MPQGRERFDGGREPTAGNQGVLAHRRVAGCVRRRAAHGHFEAVAPAEAHGDVLVAAFRHDRVVGVNDVFGGELVRPLAQALFVGDEAGEDLPADRVRVLREVFERGEDAGDPALHVHGAAPVDAALNFGRGEGRRAPVLFRHVHGVDVADQKHRGTGAARVEDGPDGGAHALDVVLEPAVVGFKTEPPQDVRDVVRGVDFAAVDGLRVDELDPTADDGFHGCVPQGGV